MAGDNKIAPLRKKVPCPECGTPSSNEDHPFCSDRCRKIDLGRWLNGAYAIPVSEADENLEPDDDSQQ